MRQAEQFVCDGLAACLPPGVPLMGQITSAKFTGKEKAEATLILFDGGYGTVEVSKWTARYEGAWALQWLALPGGAIEWTDSGWRRAAPVQLTLFDGGTAP